MKKTSHLQDAHTLGQGNGLDGEEGRKGWGRGKVGMGMRAGVDGEEYGGVVK